MFLYRVLQYYQFTHTNGTVIHRPTWVWAAEGVRTTWRQLCYGKKKGCYINADAKNTFLDNKHWPRASVAEADVETVKSHVYPTYLRFPSVGNF